MAVKGAIIAIDFDGTVVTHAYPHMGMDADAVPVLKVKKSTEHLLWSKNGKEVKMQDKTES